MRPGQMVRLPCRIFEEDWRAAKYAGVYSYAIQAGWRVLHYLNLAPQRVWQQNGLLR